MTWQTSPQLSQFDLDMFTKLAAQGRSGGSRCAMNARGIEHDCCEAGSVDGAKEAMASLDADI